MILWLSVAGACEVQGLTAPGWDLSVGGMARHSLVSVAGDCPGGVAVEVVQEAWWTASEDRNRAGCVAPEALRCPEEDGGRARIQAVWKELFDEPVPDVFVTDWGYVGLPFVHYRTDAEIRAEWEREKLRSEEQREKAVTELGPRRGESEVFVHFLGADPRYTDFWGTPDLVEALLRLASGWYDHCRELGHPDRHCTVQYGDLAWYGPRKPDPLGHYDHFAGTCVDIRLFRDDGSRYEAWWNQPDDREGIGGGYSRALTAAFLGYVAEHVPHGDLFFNDPEVGVEGVEARPRHDDHIHLCVPG